MLYEVITVHALHTPGVDAGVGPTHMTIKRSPIMKKIITLGAILAACTFAVPAMAQRGDDRVDARQDRQQQRIEKGYRSYNFV